MLVGRVKILYKNWKGETRERQIDPTQIWFGSTEYHPEEQWFLKAHDVEKDAARDFAMRDILKFDL